ncbi:MAG: hypothetical protein N3C13_04175 [Aquificaceae bacterium]|nr:hypothetical protein [Aquificaceae bacterium]MCX8060377.1 hypothetical protein [Aquificaceae bacterium]MDW8096785.1 hypothetical protein [Aquificaceae bacterium]
MKIQELQPKQKDFLKTVFELEVLPEEEELEEFLRSKGCELYACLSCGKLVFHDHYEFWNLSDCCDDNSKLVEGGLLCEVCYSRSPENMKHWILFKPTYYKEVEFRLPKDKGKA